MIIFSNAFLGLLDNRWDYWPFQYNTNRLGSLLENSSPILLCHLEYESDLRQANLLGISSEMSHTPE